MDPLDATHAGYLAFAADNSHLSKATLGTTSAALGCVYRHIGRNNPALEHEPKPLPPTVQDAFDAAQLSKRSVSQYSPRWAHWQAWCATRGVAPLDATHADYLAFAADNSHLSKATLGTTSAALGCVYRHIGRNNPALEHEPKPLPPTVQDAFDAAQLIKTSVIRYGPRWAHWQAWCATWGVDPLDATHADYLAFAADNSHLSERTLGTTSAALGCVYRHIGKNSPALEHEPKPLPPTVQDALDAAQLSKRSVSQYSPRWAHWQAWCAPGAWPPWTPPTPTTWHSQRIIPT